MAATKHLLAEGEEDLHLEQADRPSKKQKVRTDGEEKAKKKDKKDKKEKKDKKDKKSKKAKENGQPESTKASDVDTPEETTATPEAVQDPAALAADEAAAAAEAKALSRQAKQERKDARRLKRAQEAEKAKAWRGSYETSAALDGVAQTEIDSFLSTNSITVTDPTGNLQHLRPIIAFDHLPSSKLLEKNPFSAFKAPTPIQAASWPFTLSGRDVIGVAETGSGKTMAFALPCVEAISRIRGRRTVKAVVVSPTRELAMQTHAQMEQLASLVGLKCVCLYGGASKAQQRLELERGADVIVATPGRLKDFMADGVVVLSETRFAVLDEADRMLDKGFEEDIKAILSSAPPREDRQTLMFTATWPASVQALAASFMVDPVKITIGSGGTETASGAVELQANARITQRVEVVEQNNKEQRLLQILKQHQQGKQKNDRILVFCLYKKEATRVENFLKQRGVRVGGIHGDLRQEQRTRSLEAFKTGQTPVLVATDVAARGLDIPEVKLVVNVTFPLTIEDYVHRIGRTGRAGKTGEAITLFTEHDKPHSGSLINILRGAKQPVPDELLKFGTTVKKKGHDNYGAFFRDVDMTQKSTKITF